MWPWSLAGLADGGQRLVPGRQDLGRFVAFGGLAAGLISHNDAASCQINESPVGSRYSDVMSDSIARLYEAVLAARAFDPQASRTAKLLRSGRAKMAKKLAEEAVEVVIDAMHGRNEAVVKESADLIYNLVVLWVAAGVRPDDVWEEMARRERLMGIAEKIPKKSAIPVHKAKIVALEKRPLRKRHRA